MSNLKNKLWTERHRPSSVRDYIFQNPKYKAQINQMIAEQSIPHILLSGVQGSGKAQPLTSKVHTPTGWRLMGELEVGDWVSTPIGGASSIIGIYPQGDKEIYTITFHDGAQTECCLDHLWECYYIDNYSTRLSTKHIVDTKTIMEYMEKQSHRTGGKFNVSIPLTNPVIYSHNDTLPIPPYMLGVLLGDGSITGASPRITSVDEEVITNISELLDEEYHINVISGTSKEYIITQKNPTNHGGTQGKSNNLYITKLKECGLHGTTSKDKFIPINYLTANPSDRIKLLQGLLDTDGTVGKRGNISYTTISEQLSKQVQELVWSLGGTCTITTRYPTYTYKGIKKQGKLAYTLHIAHPAPSSLFTLSKKLERCSTIFAEGHSKGQVELRRRIASIKLKGIEPAQCIMISDPTHLYITDDYVVTHNTTLAFILINALNIDPSDVLVINASDENSVDTVREKIKEFASTCPLGNFKIVLLEEADFISGAAQGALRRVMEENSDTTRFILTCNYQYKITLPLQSRCTAKYQFKAPDKDDIAEYLINVLAKEEVTFDLDLLDRYIAAGYPDIRSILGALQQNTIDGVLQAPSEVEGSNEDYKFKLLDLIEQDKWVDARKIVCATVSREEYDDLYRFMYENINRSKKFQKHDLWEEAILIIAEHMYQHTSHADAEINAAAMFIKLGQLK